MNTAEILGKVLAEFNRINPKFKVKTVFTKDEDDFLRGLISRSQQTGNPDDEARVVTTYVRLLSNDDNFAFRKGIGAILDSRWIKESVKSHIRSEPGSGRLNFVTNAPPGAARLCRVPFYPMRPADAWSTRYLNIDTATPSRQSFGIDVEGDDPVLSIGPWLGNQNSTRVGPYLLRTHQVEFGSYRMIGLEINACYGSRYIGTIVNGAAATGSIAVLGADVAAQGTVDAVGPTALPASGTADIVGAGIASTGSIEFTGAGAASTGNIRIANNGNVASIEIQIDADDGVSTGTIESTDPGVIGAAQILLVSGSVAVGSFTVAGAVVTIAPGDTVNILNTGLGTGVTQTLETYVAAAVPAAANEFQSGAVLLAMQSLETLINGLPPLSTNFTVSYAVATRIMTVTQKSPGTFGNQARGAALTTVPVFTSSVTGFTGGTDCIAAGNTVTVVDLTNTARVYNAILSGAVPNVANNEFNTWGELTNAGQYLSGVLFPGGITNGTDGGLLPAGAASMDLTPSDPFKGAVNLVYTLAGYTQPGWLSSNEAVHVPIITDLAVGLDSMDYGTVITMEDIAGTSVAFAAEPAGTTVPGAYTAFQSAGGQTATLTNLRNAIIASGILLTPGPVAPTGVGANAVFSLQQNLPGRSGDKTITVTSPFGTPRAGLAVVTGMTGGDSPLTNGIELALEAISGATITFTGTDGGAATTTTFDTGRGNFATLANIVASINTNPNFSSAVVVGLTFNVIQLSPGTKGNATVSTTRDTELLLAVISGNSPTVFTGGTNCLPTNGEFGLEDVGGVTQTYTMVEAASSGNNIEVFGLATDTAAEIASRVNGLGFFNAVVNGGDPQRVDFTQILTGTQGDTTITSTIAVADLVLTSFSGGAGVYPLTGTVQLTDAEFPPNNVTFIATAATESATQFIASGSALDTATSLLDALTLSPLVMGGLLAGDVLNLTQGNVGVNGDTVITASSPPNATVVNFSGGAYRVTAGTLVTIGDTLPAPPVAFQGAVPPLTATQFSIQGSATTIANSLSTQINAFAAPPLSVVSGAGGTSTVTITQNEIGTIGNSSGAGSFPTVLTSTLGGGPSTEITVVPFAGGVDNVSVGTTVTLEDSFGVISIMSAVRGAPAAPTEFTIDNGTPQNTITNLVAQAGAIGALDITGVALGFLAQFTQGTSGPAGNTTILTNNALQFDVAGFTGGAYSVAVGAVITLEDTLGVIRTYTAVDTGAPPTAIAFDVDPNTAVTMANLNASIVLSGIQITGVVGPPGLNLTQDLGGTAGNNPILITNDSRIPTLAATGFTGGTDGGLGLVNPLSPVGIVVRELTVYNGDNIFICEDTQSLSAGVFNILNRSQQLQMGYVYNGTGITPTGQTAQPMSQFSDERGYKFVGFRDQPVVDPNAMVFVKVEAFIRDLPVWGGGAAAPYPANTPLPKIPPIPFSINLVVDVLDDRVFGDPYAPSPASRAASNVKLSKTELGHGRIRLHNVKTEK